MLRSNIIKTLFVCLLLVTPKLVFAKTLNFNDQTWQISPKIIDSTEQTSVRNNLDLLLLAKNLVLGLSQKQASDFLDTESATLIESIAAKIDQPAKNAKLVIEGKFAKEFEPGQNGQGLDVFALKNLLKTDESVINLPVVFSSPTNKLSETNNLGINELVAVGESDFTGSPSNRIHNVTVGADKFNGLIIDQGEEFSFNKYLGDVDGEHGFLPELVIKKTGVTPEFGGGLCQVSSTSFRAAMNAGLPITARRNHSFAVQYYAPQGTDATIYPGVQDLKFVNNLPSAILVHTKIDGKKLYFEYYGTKDTRTVAFEGPIQYDIKPDGSMKATWTRHVILNGQTSDQTFRSVYQPPALFHKEEQSSTPNPQAVPTINNQPITSVN